MVNTGRTLTCSANRANTMRQKMVSVMTSASCRNEWSNALMIVFRPGDVFVVDSNKKFKILFLATRFNSLRN